jgi:hypothetical protein
MPVPYWTKQARQSKKDNPAAGEQFVRRRHAPPEPAVFLAIE